MIKYWPNEQSIKLNSAVASLFIQTYKKFSLNLYNKTRNYLPINILNLNIRKHLFSEILIELEILILDIIELNLNSKQIQKLNNQILYNLVYRSMQKFLYKSKVKEANKIINFYSQYNKLFFYEHSITIEILLNYLIFGSNQINGEIFPFTNSKTPFYHVKSLLENSIIQISNIVIFNFLENYKNIEEISSLFRNKSLRNFEYKSIRDILNFRNNIMGNNLINLYIIYPQHIYCNKYKIWLISNQGIIHKYIYFNRANDYLKLSNLQVSSILYLELQDFIIPKINLWIISLGQLITYILIKIIGRSLKICLGKIIIQLNKNKN